MEFRQIGPGFAAEAVGLDLTQGIDAEISARLGRAIAEHGVVVVHNARPLTDEEHLALSRPLLEFATQPGFVHVHVWRPGDLVCWDNLCTPHRGSDFADTLYKRDVRRTTIREHELA